MAIAINRDQEVYEGRETYHGLRDWIGIVDRLGQLKRVEGANVEEDIGAITDVIQHTPEAPCVLFENVQGHSSDVSLLIGQFNRTDRIALTLGLPLGRSKIETSDGWRQKIRNFRPLPPREVKDGPIFENVKRGKDIDVTMFPTPKWHPEDGGRYIGTGSFDITRDPDDGWVNLGTYRVQLQDRDKVGYYISPGKHGRMHRQKYFDRNERMPVAMVFGSDPLLFLASCTEVPFGVSEYDWVGGVRGEPIDVIRGPITGLPLPADAEIVIEGFTSRDHMMQEGPFGEWTGYYGSGGREEPYIQIEALYYRNNPILVGSPPAQPPDEQSRFRAVLRTALLRDELEKCAIPDIVGAWCHEVGGSRLFNVVSIKQRYPGHARQTLHVASQCRAGAYTGRYVVVVDEDVDPSNLEEVMWAVCTRSDPATSIDIIKRAWSTPLDPMITPTQRKQGDFTNSRALIDACRPYEWRDQFPPINVPPRGEREAARERWGYLLED